jgi:hypothetical protein
VLQKGSYKKSYKHRGEQFFFVFHLLVLWAKAPSPVTFSRTFFQSFQWIKNQGQILIFNTHFE